MQSTPAASPHAVLFIVFFLQGFDFASKVTVGIHQTTELHECAHNGDVHFHRASAAEHAREHGDALLGECVRAITASTAGRF